MATYLRRHWPARHPRRHRTDADAARWTYHELDADGRPARHIEMRADDGTYLTAVTAGAPAPPADAQEMAAADFEELWRLARCQLDGSAQIQIHEVRPQTPEGLPVVVRCVGGRVRVGSRFDRVRETGDRVAFTVARIRYAGREVDLLTPASSAVVILAGDGRVRANQILDGHTA